MKKLFILILAVLMISGCSSKRVNNTFMITRDNTLYALYNQNGDKLTTYQYKTFEEVKDAGYIVTNDKDQVGFISLEGDEIIPFGEYETLSSSNQMLFATKKLNENQQVSKDPRYKDQNLYVINSEGDVLYSASQDVQIYKSELPVIFKDDQYTVLYHDGEKLTTSKQPIISVSQYNNGACVAVSFEDHTDLYDFTSENDEDDKTIEIKEKGSYKIMAVDELQYKGIVLYDSSLKKMIYVDRSSKAMTQISITLTKVYYDQNNNIVLQNGQTSYIYMPEKNPIYMNSYYISGDTYLVRSPSIYGPHIIYKDGKKVGELKNCQLYPTGYLISSQIFPVYVKDKGYQYYNFDNKLAFDKTYLEAEPFDANNRAVIMAKESGYSLIDETGQIITNQYYSSIKYIGNSYYAVYNDSGKFGIIDASGSEIFPCEYTYLPEEAITLYNDNSYLILGKNGRCYVYDIKDDIEEIFSVEGEVVLDKKGYFIVGNDYYTFDGDKIV